MKIWIDCRMFSTTFTGIGRVTYELVNYLEKNDTENEYVLFMNEPQYSLYIPKNPKFKKVLVNTKHYSYGEQTKFLWILYREKLDLMHFTNFNSPIFYFRPSVVTIHDTTISFYPGKKMISAHHRFAYNITLQSAVKKAKHIFAMSENTKKDVVEITKINEDRIQVVYLWADTKTFRSDYSEAELQKVRDKFDLKKPFYLYTGVWRDHKNMVRMLKSYALALKDGLDVDFAIAGKEDTVYREVRDTIIAENLQKNVKILGFVDEEVYGQLYAAARAYVLPSLYEGFGLQILEAMATGTPIISSNVSSMPEVAGPGGALFFNPTSLESMKKAMIEIDANEELRKQLVTTWFARVKEFSWDKMGAEVHKAYLRVLSKNQKK